MRCPTPARASYRDLLRDLLGHPVTVRPGTPQLLAEEREAYLACYRFDDGSLASLAVTDLWLGAAMAASIAMMPFNEVREQVEDSGRLDEELLEFLHEVVNVSAKLLNSPSTPHVVLRDLSPVPGDVTEDVATMATTPERREDWLVAVEGYGEGVLTLLA